MLRLPQLFVMALLQTLTSRETLCGNLHPFPLAVRHNFSGSLDTAEDYYATYSPLWGQYPEALLFVNWLYNHSSVLHERAEIIKCAEMLMQEDDFEICESILKTAEAVAGKNLMRHFLRKLYRNAEILTVNMSGPGYCRFQQQEWNNLKHPASVDIALVYLSNK